MKKDMLVSLWWLVFVTSFAIPAYGMVESVPLEYLVKGSSHIVIGQVEDLRPVWGPWWKETKWYWRMHDFTDIVISVERYIKGPSRGDTIVIRQSGGVIEPIPPEGIRLPDGQIYKPGAKITLPEGVVDSIYFWFPNEFEPEILPDGRVRIRIPDESSVLYHSLGFDLFGYEDGVDDPDFEEGEHVLLFLCENKGGGDDERSKLLHKPGTFYVKGLSVGKWTIDGNQVMCHAEDLKGEYPLQEVIDRIEEEIKRQAMGLRERTWGWVKRLFLLNYRVSKLLLALKQGGWYVV